MQTLKTEKIKVDGKSHRIKHNKYILILKDIHQGYPSRRSPELAPLYEWADQDSSVDLTKAVSTVRRLAVEKAEEMADSEGIMYATNFLLLL